MNTRSGLRGAALAACIFLLPATAAAQGYPPPPPPGGGGPGGPAAAPQSHRDEQGFWQRRGIYGGLGLGFGSMTADCGGCSDESLESIGFHFDVGFRLNPKFGLFLDGWGLAHPEDTDFGTVTLTHAIATVGAQLWVTPQLWIKGGIGSAQLSINYEDGDRSESDTVAGVMAAAGFELLSSPSFSLDGQLRIGNGFYDDGSVQNISVQFSVNWHSLWGGALVVVN